MLKSKGFSVAILSGVGILATFLFQVATARLLAPSEYGLVAAFLAIVNIAAIGAGALQNAVTVQVAKQENSLRLAASSQYSKVFGRLFSTFDATTIEAAVLGFSGAILLLLFYEPLSQELHTDPIILFAAAATIPISFFISRDLGILQGKERTVATVTWSTLSAVFRLLLAVLFLLAFQNAGAAILGVFIALVITVIALWIQVKQSNYKATHRPFNVASLSVIGITILFAWLTNIDIVFVRADLSAADAGNYAVAASIIKATLIVPGTISLFLLPKLAKQTSISPLGKPLLVTLIVSLSGILILTALLFLFGSYIFGIIFGHQYDFSNSFLATVSITFTPWLLSQALLIKLNARTIFIGVPMLFVIALAQAVLFSFTLPNLNAALWGNGAVGIVCFTAMLWILWRKPNNKQLEQVI